MLPCDLDAMLCQSAAPRVPSPSNTQRVGVRFCWPGLALYAAAVRQFFRHRPPAAAGRLSACVVCCCAACSRRRRFECCFSGRLWAAGQSQFLLREMLDMMRGAGREVGWEGVVQLQNTKGRPAGLLDGVVVSLVFASRSGSGEASQPPGTCFVSSAQLWCLQHVVRMLSDCGVAAAAWTHTHTLHTVPRRE